MDEMYNNQNEYQEQLYMQEQPQPQNQSQELEEPVSLGEWLITLLILMIPCANIIMAFVWAFSSNVKKSKSNYFKAYLIFAAIVFVVYLVVFAVLGATAASIISGLT